MSLEIIGIALSLSRINKMYLYELKVKIQFSRLQSLALIVQGSHKSRINVGQREYASDSVSTVASTW